MAGRRRSGSEAPGESGECSVHEGLRRLTQLFPRVSRGLRRRGAGGDGPDLGARHGVALALLRDHGPLSVGRLAAEMDLTLATVSGLVGDLERAGFAERAPDPGDRRRTIVRLAGERCDLATAWLEATSAPMARALGRLTSAERAVFVKAMEILRDELDEPQHEALG